MLWKRRKKKGYSSSEEVHQRAKRDQGNAGKMKELILYISQKCEGDDTFGSIKLNKLLFYSDFLAYLNLGKPITGMEYMRLDHGPAPRHLAYEKVGIESGTISRVHIPLSQII